MMRSLLFAALLFSAPINVPAAVDGETPPEQAAAIKALRGIASNIQKNRNGTVRFVRFSRPVVTDEHLKHIVAFKQIDYLAVVTSKVTDTGLANVKGLTNLDSLILTNTQLTDEGLGTFVGLTKLEVLYLDKTKITSAGLGKVGQLKALKILWLTDTAVTNEGVGHLSGLENLEVLNLSGTKVDDSAVEHIAALPKLRALYLDRTSVTGRTLANLSALKELEFLSMAGTPLEPASIPAIAGIASLKQVNLYKTKITAEDLGDLPRKEGAPRFTLAPRPDAALTPFQKLLAGKPLLAAPQVRSLALQSRVPREEAPALESQATEVPDFQRHVVPLLGTLGCNGRACHGSFQGQGGFSLSMFGYDFQADHKELTEKDQGRVDLKQPDDSLILRKPTGQEDHEGGDRYAKGGWEYKLLHRWIAAGAKGKPALDRLVEFKVTPPELVFSKPGESVQLTVVATWEDGRREDVTRLTRFEVKDDQVATVARGGLVTCKSAGDTHVMAMYDKGVVATPAIMPVSGRVSAKFPDVPTPSKIDELVVSKLSKLGIVPADLCTDEEFLRRVYLDIAGTLPAPGEIQDFLADTSSSKRADVIDKLLETEAYATWWGMWLTDLTGSNIQVLGGTDINWAAAGQWEKWLKQRVKDNDGWDKIAAGILLAASRRPNQSYAEYAAEQSHYLRRKDPEDSSTLEFPMHHYWFRGNARKPIDRALSFGYIFLGVRLQCAQCHKHPFDRWSKQDFDQFTNFFTRISLGANDDAKLAMQQLKTRLGVPVKLDTAALRRQMYMRVFAEGLPIPYVEVMVRPPGKTPSPARLLGGEEFDLNQFADPREPLVEWLLRKDNPYFARAFVNRVWARYFGAGIVDPPDDFNIGNPPSNAALLDWLAQEFIAHGYDMKWLHRTITGSRTYQLSWKTNPTNANDSRHFSHARLRRLPAEVIVDGMLQATNNNGWNGDYLGNMYKRRIGKHPGNLSPSSFDYALMVFGKPTRSTNCDCERKSQPTLLQSLYTRNDAELLERIERPDGWVSQIAHQLKAPLASRTKSNESIKATKGALDSIKEKLTPSYLVEQAYLRTLSRHPSEPEKNRSAQYLQESANIAEGLRDLMWVLLNTQEFLTNH